MSNPGVIVLFSRRKKFRSIKYLQIEDNIGECIHIHLNNYRFDLSINDLFALIDMAESSLIDLDMPDYKDDVPRDFLYDIYSLSNFRSFSYQTMSYPINQLNFIARKGLCKYFSIVSIYKILDTPHYKALVDSANKNLTYQQLNYFGTKSTDRLKDISDYVMSVDRNSLLPLVVFGDNLLVRDGIHRAAALCKQHGAETQIKVLRINTTDSISAFRWPWLWNLRINAQHLINILKRLYVSIFR